MLVPLSVVGQGIAGGDKSPYEAEVAPWGGSVPIDKAERNDSPWDGCGCDTATTHREKKGPAQMTLMAFQESKPSASDD